MERSIDLNHPSPLTVAGYVRHHLDMVADLSPAELNRLARAAHRAAAKAESAAKRAGESEGGR